MEPEKIFTTESGFPIKHVYTQEDLEEIGFDYQRDLNEPGQFPYTRGIDPEMYRKNYWVMGQYAGYGSAEEANKKYKFILDQGATGFSIALDLPTQVGYDSDHPLAQGEVGKIGVAIDSLRDMEIIFDGIPIDRAKHIRTTAVSIGPIALAMFLAVAERQGISPNHCSVILQNDVLKEYPVRGTQIFPSRSALRFAADAIEYCAKELSMSAKLIDIYQLSEKIGLKPQTIRNRLHEGTFPLTPMKQGGRKNFWRESDVDEYIEELRPDDQPR